MAGIRLAIPSKFTNTALPVLRADGILPARGALYLLDASHTAGAWPGGKSSGMILPNIAADQATALTGAPLTGLLEYAGASVKVARSGKGGWHVEQTTNEAPIPAGNFARITVPVSDYIAENPGHHYYMSQWTRSTRGNKTAAGAPFFTQSAHNGSVSYLASLFRNNNTFGHYPNAGNNGAGQWIGGRSGQLEDGKTTLQNVAAAGWIGTPPAAASDIAHAAFGFGRVGRIIATAPWPALIVYRCYMEDLTVSGRTYAEVDALDAEAYTRECLTAGGRYYNDTYTQPVI